MPQDSKWFTHFSNQLKRQGIEVSIFENGNLIQLKKGSNQLQMLMEYEFGIGDLIVEKGRLRDQELLEAAKEYFTLRARHIGVKLFFVFTGQMEPQEIDLLSAAGFHTISSLVSEQAWQQATELQYTHVVEVEKESFSLLYQIHLHISRFLSKKKQKDPTMVVSGGEWRVYNQIIPIPIAYIDLYYQGMSGTLSFQCSDGCWSLQWKDVLFPIKHPVHVDAALEHIFQSIHEQMRIKNVFDPPKKHFKELFASHFSHSEETAALLLKNIYQELLKGKTPQDVEVQALGAIKGTIPFHFHTDAALFSSLIRLDQHVIVVTHTGAAAFFSLSEKEAAIRCYQKACTAEVKERSRLQPHAEQKLFH